MYVFVLGGSKNIGYHAALRLLKQGATVTFLLRNTSVFESDEEMQPFIKGSSARLVSGDALNVEDVRKGWQAALNPENGSLDLVLFTVGGTPSFSLSRGLYLDPPDLCTRGILNLLSTIPQDLRDPNSELRFVVITSTGVTASSYADVPLLVKPVYGAISAALADKLGVERVLAYVRGRSWSSAPGDQVRKEVLPDGWEKTPELIDEGVLRKRLVVVRPTILTDGPCCGDAAQAGETPYRVAVESNVTDGYRVSRMDTAHFIVRDLLPHWEKYAGQGVALAY